MAEGTDCQTGAQMIARLALAILVLLPAALVAHALLPQSGAIKAQVAQNKISTPMRVRQLSKVHDMTHLTDAPNLAAYAAPAWPRKSRVRVFGGIAGVSTSQHLTIDRVTAMLSFVELSAIAGLTLAHSRHAATPQSALAESIRGDLASVAVQGQPVANGPPEPCLSLRRDLWSCAGHPPCHTTIRLEASRP
jgi:hypothetical protein